LCNDPQLRSTQNGIQVCSFTVAVNRRKTTAEAGPEADFFRVTAWRGLADNCAKFLSKGRKVAVTGSISVSTYTGQDGNTRASMDVNADDVEFLTPKGDMPAAGPTVAEIDKGSGFVKVDEELPF
jgi:single-strand DNA-binding protein